jgi:hypothetical protein
MWVSIGRRHPRQLAAARKQELFLNLNSDIALTENPISFGIDTLKREVSTSAKLALL